MSEYIKQNKLYILVMLLGSLIFLVQIDNVVLYADDFIFASIGKQGVGEILKYFVQHYLTWGGGFSDSISTILLSFGINAWKILHFIIIIITVILITKLITNETGKNKAVVSGTIWLCIYILSINVSREVLYWVSGGVVYVLTSLQVLLYIYFLYTRLFLKINKKYDNIVLPITAFFAGWSYAQPGFLVLVIPIILLIWKKAYKKESIPKIYYLTIVLGILGYAIFYFAPGNYLRLSNFSYYTDLSIIERIAYRLNDVYGLMFDFTKYNGAGIPFYLYLTMGLSVVIGINYAYQDKNKKVKSMFIIMSSILTIYLFMIFIASLKIPGTEKIAQMIMGFDSNLLIAKAKNVLKFKLIMPYIISTIALVALSANVLLISIRSRKPFIFTIIISAIIMQFIMVMSPFSSFRTTYYTTLFMWIGIAYIINEIYCNRIIDVRLIIIVFLTILLVAIINMTTVIDNYKTNKTIYEKNMEIIDECRNSKEDIETLELYEPKNATYGFTPITSKDADSLMKERFKKYFGLSDKLEIVGMKYTQQQNSI